MSNVLILTEVQEAMRARYKAMLLERFPQLTINVVGHHNDVGPYIATTDILLCFSPPMADHVVHDAPRDDTLVFPGFFPWPAPGNQRQATPGSSAHRRSR